MANAYAYTLIGEHEFQQTSRSSFQAKNFSMIVSFDEEIQQLQCKKKSPQLFYSKFRHHPINIEKKYFTNVQIYHFLISPNSSPTSFFKTNNSLINSNLHLVSPKSLLFIRRHLGLFYCNNQGVPDAKIDFSNKRRKKIDIIIEALNFASSTCKCCLVIVISVAFNEPN